mgnify:CR=1 FL=1
MALKINKNLKLVPPEEVLEFNLQEMEQMIETMQDCLNKMRDRLEQIKVEMEIIQSKKKSQR